ncbi:MAG: hypothetical protein OXN95_04570 [bacterium]|uniref:hypothetical protein n=1 Tax=Candidatus Poriferisocius sp. TaxID=3101276 RepID=UPI00239E5879|nr:hypothetical protein [bacterium]
MKQQLTLLEAPPDWRIDERTKEIGRRGLAQARAALQRHSPAVQPATSPSDDVPRAA